MATSENFTSNVQDNVTLRLLRDQLTLRYLSTIVATINGERCFIQVDHSGMEPFIMIALRHYYSGRCVQRL
jgi:hypothetical protein